MSRQATDWGKIFIIHTSMCVYIERDISDTVHISSIYK